jgi:hypothetical protein
MAETPETPPTPPTPPQPEDTSPSLEPLAAVAEVPLDLPQLQLPTGRYEAGQPPRLHPGDLIWESLRSAFIVDPNGDNERWVAFSYGPSNHGHGGPHEHPKARRQRASEGLGDAGDTLARRLERIAQDFGTDATKALAAEIARVRTRLSPPRPLTCWIHIEGYLRGTTS